jgi:hypothetical protein
MAFGSAGAACAQSCDQLTKFKIPGTELTIAEAESVAAGSAQGVSRPAYCRVDGTIDPRTGVGGKLRRRVREHPQELSGIPISTGARLAAEKRCW